MREEICKKAGKEDIRGKVTKKESKDTINNVKRTHRMEYL